MDQNHKLLDLNRRPIGRRPSPAASSHKIKPSYPQVQLLLEFLEEHPQLAAGYNIRTPEDRYNAVQLWGQLTVRLNAIKGSRRNTNGWKKYWVDKKSYIKRVSQRIAAAHRTGVGLDTVQAMSKLDRRLLALIETSSGQDAENPITNCDMNPLSPVSSIASADSQDKSHIQTDLWAAAQTPDSPEQDKSELKYKPPASSMPARPSVKREHDGMEWMEEIERERLMLERERIALQRERNQQEARFQEQVLQRKQERNKQEARFQEHVLERMDGMFSRVADALMQLANSSHH